jgi:hypothetical protein
MESFRNKMKISIPDIETNEPKQKDIDQSNCAIIVDELWEIKVRHIV